MKQTEQQCLYFVSYSFAGKCGLDYTTQDPEWNQTPRTKTNQGFYDTKIRKEMVLLIFKMK